MTRPSNQPAAPAAIRTAVRTEEVTARDDGRRLDNFLATRLKEAPRSLIYKLVRSGQVRVNGGRAKPEQRLACGDRIRIPPLTLLPEHGPASIPAARIAALETCILHEDAHVLVLDKPAGLACHGGSGVRYGVIEIMRAARPALGRLDLAHRLDRDTSGCLVMCKDLPSLRLVNTALRERETRKEYVALLRGHLPAELRRIDATLGIARDAHGERRAAVASDGKAASTVIETATPIGSHTLVRLRLLTGRMHQIRAHARHIGHPIAGDPLYGDAGFDAELATLGLDRLFLHAARIVVPIPGGHLDIGAPLPAELTRVLDALAAPATP